MVSVFEGQLSRTWNYQLNASARMHVITLYHDTITGVRSAMLDYEEIPNSLGNSSLLMESKGHRLFFVVEDQGGYIEIMRSGFTGFTYKCAVNNVYINEITQVVAKEDGAELYRTEIIDTVYTPDIVDGSSLAAMTIGGAKQITWYAVKTTRLSDGIVTTVHRRFKEFAELNSQCKQNLKGNHLRSSLPPLPDKPLKITTDHSDANFINQRKIELNNFLRQLISVPHVSEMNCLKAFIGIINHVREFSVLFTLPQLGLQLQPNEKIKSMPVIVGSVLNAEQSPGIFAGDAVSKINGVPIVGMNFKGVVQKIKIYPRPLMIHFIQLISKKTHDVISIAVESTSSKERSSETATSTSRKTDSSNNDEYLAPVRPAVSAKSEASEYLAPVRPAASGKNDTPEYLAPVRPVTVPTSFVNGDISSDPLKPIGDGAPNSKPRKTAIEEAEEFLSSPFLVAKKDDTVLLPPPAPVISVNDKPNTNVNSTTIAHPSTTTSKDNEVVEEEGSWSL